MPVQFRTLGVMDLRDAEGREMSAVLRQPKRLALLAYLAFARPRGFHQRDELLALLWPDHDEQHARASLRKTVHVLRSELGADVVLSRGDDELALDITAIQTDVATFEAALAEGRPLEAAELFHGEFLRGFHADASPEFERWLDAERQYLRERAASAAAAVSELQNSAGDPAGAVTWGRRALELAPLDERVLRRLLLRLDAAGDRAGALDVYQSFAARMTEEYDVDPAPETVALVAAIRARSQSTLTFEEPQTPGDSAVVALPGLSGAAGPRTAMRAGRWRYALPVAVTAVVGLTIAMVALRGRGVAGLDPGRLAIAPFQVFDSTLTPWGVGVVEFVSRGLDQAGGLRMVPPSVAVRAWKGSVDAATALAFGRATGAGLVLFGSLLGQGGDAVRISATLVDAQSGATIGAMQIPGSRDRIDLVVDSLSVEIVRTLAASGRVVPLPHSRLSARSMPALMAFLAGETALRRGAWDSAQASFQEAVRLDSTFALAWIRLGGTTLYADVEGGPGWRYILRAAALQHGLSRHDSMYVEVAVGLASFLTGRVPRDSQRTRAARVYGTALALAKDYPDDAEAWYAVGAVRDQLFNLLNVTWVQVAEAYTRAIALDSAFVPAYAPALKFVMELGDTVTGRRLARQFLALHPPERSRGLPLLIDRLFDPSASVADRERLLDSLPPEALFRTWVRTWLLPGASERAIQVARALARRQPDPRYWFTAPRISQRDLAATLAYRGHVREAFALAGTDDNGWFSNLLANLAMVGVVPPAVADSALREWVGRKPFGAAGLTWSFWWWSQRGDTAALATYLAHSPSPRPDARAALALARHDTATAIHELQAWQPVFNDDPWGIIMLARLLAATGREREALTVLQREFFTDWPLVGRVIWRLERGRLAERLGQPEAARADYAWVEAVWKGADPELARYVTEAREGRERLVRRRPPLLGRAAPVGHVAPHRLPLPLDGRAPQRRDHLVHQLLR